MGSDVDADEIGRTDYQRRIDAVNTTPEQVHDEMVEERKRFIRRIEIVALLLIIATLAVILYFAPRGEAIPL